MCPELLNKPCTVSDCAWFDWSSWTECSKSCGGGQQERKRHIRQAPNHGGAACPAKNTTELQPCGMVSCANFSDACIDGKWDDWSEWGACTASCKGGVKYRHRTVAEFPNYCGKQLEDGLGDRQYESCHTDVSCGDSDCELYEWNDWRGCNSQCDGVSRRERKIKNRASGKGAECDSELEQVKTCNPSSETAGCEQYVPVDCEYGEWTHTDCTTTCGKGQWTRTRAVKVQAKHGGVPCNSTLVAISPCEGQKECPVPEPKDCTWEDWSDWGACSQCTGGERKRFRKLVTPALYGGKPCEGATQIDTVDNNAVSIVDTQACANVKLCHRTYCIWGSWDDWGTCNKPCGGGRRERRRTLFSSPTPAGEDDDDDDAVNKADVGTYEKLRREVEEKDKQRWQELSVAFVGGCGIFFLAAVAIRFARNLRNKRETTYRPLGLRASEAMGSRDDDDAEMAIE